MKIVVDGSKKSRVSTGTGIVYVRVFCLETVSARYPGK